jgi:hypothetical protein
VYRSVLRAQRVIVGSVTRRPTPRQSSFRYEPHMQLSGRRAFTSGARVPPESAASLRPLRNSDASARLAIHDLALPATDGLTV